MLTLDFDKGSTGEDNRITNFLRNYWDYTRDELNFPSEGEVKQSALAKYWDNCFIIEADNSFNREDFKYKYLGTNIIKAYGSDLTGINADKLASPEAGHLIDLYEKILAFKRPVIDEGEMHLPDGKILKYRQILLPLGEDGVKITAILGGMSYKIFD